MLIKDALKKCKGNVRGWHKPDGKKPEVRTGRYNLTKKHIAHQASELSTQSCSLPVDAIGINTERADELCRMTPFSNNGNAYGHTNSDDHNERELRNKPHCFSYIGTKHISPSVDMRKFVSDSCVGATPTWAISSPEPQFLSNSLFWSGKYPGTFESITTIHSHHKTKYPGTLLFIPKCSTVPPSAVPQSEHSRLLEGSQKTHHVNKNGLKVDVGAGMLPQYNS